jgi:B9 domain-containing protein 1
VVGPDWVLGDGQDEAITQMGYAHSPFVMGPMENNSSWLRTIFSALWGSSLLTPNDFSACNSLSEVTVWNCAFHASYSTTNVFGWPQLVVAVYGLDGLGRDVLFGYSCIRVPCKAGRYVEIPPLQFYYFPIFE